MRIKKPLSILLAVIMLGTILPSLPFSANAVVIDTAATADGAVRYSVSDAAELRDAITAINTAGAGNYVIELTGDITPNQSLSFSTAGQVVTIIGNGHTLTNTADAIVHVWDGAQVNLGDGETALILQSGTNSDMPGIVYVNGAASVCNMYDKVTLRDHQGNNHYGGGVTVHNGTFHMYGGTIENCGIEGGSVCFGGGVAVFGGLFIMDGGLIDRCYARSDAVDDQDPNRCFTALGGGVFLTGGSEFIMNGGTISRCEATNMGGGVAEVISYTEQQSYGMGNIKSTVIINDGTISGNIAGEGAGVFASGYFYCHDEVLGTSSVPGIGLTANPGLYINGGTITQNVSDDMGGGILLAMLRPNTVTVHNAIISENAAYDGAGIEVFGYWTKTDIDGCTITDNRAEANGGGIMLSSNSSGGYTNLKNTTITGNTSGDRGAGVYYDANSTLYISGADVIQNNKYNGKLNNLNILSLAKPVYVNGALTDSQIGLSDPTLWDDDKEDIAADAVSTLRLTNGYKANNASLIPADAFTSDHESWYVDYGEKKTEQGAEIGRTYTYPAREYTAVSRTTGSQAARGSLVDVVAKTTFSSGGKASSNAELYNEITTRYKEEYQETSTDNYYDPISGSSIEVLAYSNGVYIYIDNAILFAGISYQGYVDEGHFALVFLSGTLDNADFSDEYTEETVVLDEPIDDDETAYGFNDIGHIVSKTVMIKSSEVVDIQYETVTTDYTNEVRLVRKNPDYHINNADIIAAAYDDQDDSTDDDIFTSYVESAGGTVTFGDTLTRFYAIPAVTPTAENSCPYIFKGWYYDPVSEDEPVAFGTDKFTRDIYAHWITVNDVDKDEEDTNVLPAGDTKYGGFDLSGIQIKEGIIDTNFDYAYMPGGMRFLTSLSMDVVNAINALQPDSDIEYGFVAATNKDWIDYHEAASRKLLYVSATANGVDTVSDSAPDEDYFGFAMNVNCTSRQSNAKYGVVTNDHRNYAGYLLYTLVITYEDASEGDYDKQVLAHPYIRYYDANNSERVAYSEYRGGSKSLGGCYTSYNAVTQ